MNCDRYWELLSLELDGLLSGDEAKELEEHLSVCPDCRAAGARLAALRSGFAELKDIPAPEGFARGVMERIREEARPKVIPLFKRPQIRALAGLAACLVLAVGLYGASRPRHLDKREIMDVTARSFNRDAQAEAGDSPQVNAGLVDPELADAPQLAAYAAPEDGVPLRKAAPNPAADGMDGDWANAEITLTLDRLPQGEGMGPLLMLEERSTPDEDGRVCMFVSLESLEQAERLAREQGINAERTAGTEANGHYVVVILDKEG